MPGEGKIEENWVQLSLGPICSFKNQVVMVSGYWGFTYSHLSDTGNDAGLRMSLLLRGFFEKREDFIWQFCIILADVVRGLMHVVITLAVF